MAERILVLGGARSGKSAVAESLVRDPVVYVATGQPADAELAERVAAHRARRPRTWTTVETTDVAAALRRAHEGSGVLIDALGPWLADRMTAHGLWAPPEATVAPMGDAGRGVVEEAVAWWDVAGAHRGGPVVVVADESGLGVTPPDPSSRRWLDVAGAVLQRLAADADQVLLVVAGRPLPLPGPGGVRGGVRSWCPSTASNAHTPDLAAHGDRMVPAGAVDFAVNVHGDGPPAHVREALEKALDDVGRYPDDTGARAAAAKRHGRDPSEVAVTAGAAEAFRLLAAATRTRLAAVVHPAFTEPEAALRAAGVPVTHVLRDPADGWALDPAAVPDDADLVVVGNPNSPTGTLDDPERVTALCRAGRLTVVDEAFMDFVADETASVAGRADLPGLVVVRSVTKLWCLPGVRAGYLLGPPGLVERLGAARQPWPVGAHALAALAVCCDDEAYRRQVALAVADARDQLRAALDRLPGIRAWPSAANFLLVKVPEGTVAALRSEGIAVRPSTFPGLGTEHMRVAVREPDTNRLLIDALRRTCA